MHNDSHCLLAVWPGGKTSAFATGEKPSENFPFLSLSIQIPPPAVERDPAFQLRFPRNQSHSKLEKLFSTSSWKLEAEVEKHFAFASLSYAK